MIFCYDSPRKLVYDPAIKWVKDMNRFFTKKDNLVDKWAQKMMFSIIVFREMKVKTTVRYHTTGLLEKLK